MPYIPVVPIADRRQRYYSMVPVHLLNMFAVPIPAETGEPCSVVVRIARAQSQPPTLGGGGSKRRKQL